MQTQEKKSVAHVEISKALKTQYKRLFCKLYIVYLGHNMNM